MENRTDFDLNQHVRNWRASLGNRPGIRDEDVEELESHLRETFERLCKTGLTREEVFLVAARRIGSPGELEEQYATVNAALVWRTRAGWMIAGVLGYWAWLGVSGILSKLALLVAAGHHIEGTTVGYFGLALQVIGMAIAWVWVVRRTRRQTSVEAGGPGNHAGINSLRFTLLLALAVLTASSVNFSLMFLVSRLHDPNTIGSYAFVSAGSGVLNFLAVVVLSIWLALQERSRLSTA